MSFASWRTIVFELLQDYSRGREVTLQSRFVDDLGMDSLDFVELIVLFEKRTGLTLPDEQLVSATTVEALLSRIGQHFGDTLNA